MKYLNKIKKIIRLGYINIRNPYSISTYLYLNRLSSDMMVLSDLALTRAVKLKDVKDILDIGSGEGLHAEKFLKSGKMVTCIDYGKSIYFDKKSKNINAIVGDYINYRFKKKFDLLWLSHVLEHQSNPGQFLEKCYSDIKLGGYIMISVPPRKECIVGGHVTFFNPGILLYQLVLAGFDCSESEICCYGYNISILAKKTESTIDKSILSYDAGDISIIKHLLPKKLKYSKHINDISFNGKIKKYNWAF